MATFLSSHMQFMCKAVGVAIVMINKSVDLADAKKEKDYLLDFVKIHKLLYLAQCYMLYKYNKPLFDEEITAHYCGPYVDGISCFRAEYGNKKIDNKVDFLPLPPDMTEAIEIVLTKYGLMNADNLVKETKQTTAYVKQAALISDFFKPLITREDMIETGKILFQIL